MAFDKIFCGKLRNLCNVLYDDGIIYYHMPSFGKTNPLRREHFADFERAYRG